MSKAAKRRAKRNRQMVAGLPDLAPTKARKTRGRARMKEIRAEKDASIPVLNARLRQSGMEKTEEAMREMKAPWRGCNAGRAMASTADSADHADLWDAICHIRKTVAAYDAAIGAPRRHAVCLRLLAPSDALTADAETPPLDDRPDEERSRSAVSAWMRLHGWLGWADKAAASECLRVVADDARCTNPVGLISALRCVSDGIKGRRMVYRGA